MTVWMKYPPSSTTYTLTNTTGNIDTFTITDCTEDIDNIVAVQAEVYCAYDGSPTPTHIQTVFRSGSTNYPSGVDISPGTSFSTQYYIAETDPATGTAWTESGVNALEVGYKATA